VEGCRDTDESRLGSFYVAWTRAGEFEATLSAYPHFVFANYSVVSISSSFVGR
jgi:hypothetical protein